MTTGTVNRIRKAVNGKGAKEMTKATLELSGIKVTVALMLVTPALAVQWLERNKRNRPLSNGRVQKYAKEMREGRWKFNGLPILFDDDGNLLDAQHRLWACIESGETFAALVVTGLDADCFPTIDQNAKRSLADNFALLNRSNYSTLAAAAVRLRRYEKGVLWASGTDAHIPIEEGIETLSRHPGLEDSVHYGRPVSPLLPPGLTAFLHYVFSEKDPDAADDFMERLATGERLVKGTGIYALRERLLKHLTEKANLPERELAALTIKAWNADREGRQIRYLRWRTGGEKAESFPEII